MHARRVILAAAVLAACGGGDRAPVTTPPPAPAPPVVAQVELTLAAPSLFPRQTAQLTAVVRDDRGGVIAGAPVAYASSAPGVAAVSASGLLTTVAPGTATITATAGGRAGSATVTVRPVPAASLSLSPGRSFLVTADTLQLTATVLDSTGAPAEGHAVTWTVGDSAVARIDAAGRLVPRAAGRVVVRASVGDRSAESVIDVVVGRGLRVPELAVYDSVVPALMARYRLPGASLALMKDGRLLAARSYGWADTVLRQPVEPASLFRYASLSKPITSAAVMKLVEEGRLKLDDRIFTLLPDLRPPAGRTADPRLADITVLHALTHSAGWNAAHTEDPLWESRVAAQTLGESFPASPRTLARFWMGKPLSFDPGTSWSYGQIGYVLLHLVVERVTGRRYDDYVREAILAPSGAVARLGRTSLAGRLPGEVRYYYYPGDMPDNMAPTGMAPPEYGWHDIEGNAAAAGWVGTATDFLRFVAAIDGDPARPDVLAPATLAQIAARPLPAWGSATTWYALGWYSRGGSPHPVMYHGGNTWGTLNWVRRMDNGVSVVLLTNGPVAPHESTPVSTAVNNALVAAAATVATWPTGDLFARY